MLTYLDKAARDLYIKVMTHIEIIRNARKVLQLKNLAILCDTRSDGVHCALTGKRPALRVTAELEDVVKMINVSELERLLAKMSKIIHDPD